MICKNCGKEIPDGAKFCGFCGALQTVEETAPEAEKAVPVENTEEKQTEAPVEEKEPEEPEEPKEEKKNTFQEKAEGVKEKVLGDNGKLDQGDFKRMGNEAASGIKSAASKVQWNQYKELLDVLKNPFELHDLSVLPAATFAVFTLIINWVSFGGFVPGLMVTLIIYAGALAVMYLGDRKSFSWKKGLSRVVSLTVIPVLAVTLAAVFSAVLYSNLTNESMAFNFYMAMNAVRSNLLAMIILYLIAAVSYTISLTKVSGKLNAYVLLVIVALVFCLIAYILLNDMMGSMMTLSHAG